MKRFAFVIAEMATPISLDPLEADYSNNLHASQMVHKSLLEVADDNTLQSSVLKSFSYSPEKREIRLTLDERARYSDGSPVTVEDIAMSLKRMMLRRPTFPVLKHIVGIAEWAKSPQGLKEAVPGLRIDNSTVIVELEKDVKNPLFRFALPIYGVVKSDCVDMATNKLKADCPVSGFYSLAKTDNTTYTFVRNKTVSGAKHELPESVDLVYHPNTMESADYQALKDGTHVIFTEENTFDSKNEEIQTGLGFARFEQPNARFSVFQLNPQTQIFADVKCRQQFARTFREELARAFNQKTLESSIFSRIVPGYMSAEQLAETVTLSKSDEDKCAKIFAGREVRWMPQSTTGGNTFVQDAITATAKRLGLKLKIVTEVSRQNRFDAFVNNQLDVLMAGSGFWAFDPVGDIQMLFTRGLHKPLKFLSEDDHLQKLLDGLEFEADPSARMRAINAYLYQQGLFNVYSHSKRVYVVKGDGVSRSIPVAITPPAPWQVFSVDQK